MQDIADAAGVHIMTVSNALSGQRKVAPATRERVRQIARELHYVPNSAARALVTGRTGVIAVMSGPLNEPFYANMVYLLEQQMLAEDYKVLLLRKPDEVKDLIYATGNTAVDGAIAVDRTDVVEEFRIHSAVPCVAVGTYGRTLMQTIKADLVAVDLSAGVAAALDYMIGADCRKIAYVATVDFMASDEEIRARTYRSHLKKAKLARRFINLQTELFDEMTPRLKLEIEANGCPDALLCQNDDVAMCAYRALRDLSFRVPDDVLLVGCDGQKHMNCFDPPLSTIAQPMEAICAQAWQFLRQRIAQPSLPLQHATLQGELIVRASLGAPVAPSKKSRAEARR